MGWDDVDELRDDVSALHLDRGSNLAFVHHEHPALQFHRIAQVGNRLALFD